MFGFRWVLPWVWGAGLGGSGPVVTEEGPFWVSPHHCVAPRMYPLTVQPYVVAPGRTWSPDPTLHTFKWFEAE
jgi:hypothetical protein